MRRLYWLTWSHCTHISDDGKVALCGWKMTQYMGEFKGMSGQNSPEVLGNVRTGMCKRCAKREKEIGV